MLFDLSINAVRGKDVDRHGVVAEQLEVHVELLHNGGQGGGLEVLEGAREELPPLRLPVPALA